MDEDSEGGVDNENSVCDGGSDENLHFEAVARQFFESAEGVALNLEDVLICLTDFTHELSRPPLEFSMKTFMEINKKDNDPFSQSINLAAQYALENLEIFKVLACVFWCRIATIFNDYLTHNLKEVHMTNKNFTCATGKLHELFLTNEYRSDIISAFNVEKWSDVHAGQKSLAAKLLFHLYELFTAEVGKRVQKQEEEDPVCFRVDEMEAEGKD